MNLKVLIVDDEYPARMELRYLLESHPEIQVVGEAADSYEALELIKAVDYAILFLDIDMPGFSGLELAKKVQNSDKKPCIIFITAHEQFAFNAFGVDAVDYLLKPIDPARLAKAINKAAARVKDANATKKQKEETTADTVKLGLIPVEHGGRTILLKENNIVFARASQDYSYIHTAKENFLTRFTLKELETRLDPQQFYRCHRSYLVNIKMAKEVTPLYNGTLILTLDDAKNSEIPVSRSQAKQMRKILGI
ncbi:MAG: LytTR family DNA-binding domain-containing protein [Bacillota bacterium]